ncbi:hypothetical protein [Aliiroseovarius sp. F47248L]|uniref:hypothetical protein n=1 Tax=Aliiroseovarius sp. F47248L TaxID=2926420 RepID=UPI001FF150C1|nr:hypothetical protein [Aliiroseovarius sp. F47248L]MCK0140508.1 hypothetical protein [Aliiroseovarius sp. F47248L]
MRISTILIAILIATTSHADTIDLDDPSAFCSQMAQVYDWTDDSEAVANCPCSFAGLKDQMTSELFEITIQWQLDPAILRNGLPDGMTIANFYDTVAPVFGAVEQSCGPMR